MRLRYLALLAVAVVAVVAVGCGSNDSSADATTTSPSGLSLTSAAFRDGELIPDQHAFSDDNQSPPLRWSGVPTGTEELAISVVDPDASNFIHWVVAGIDPTTRELDAGRLPAGAVEALNSFEEPDWSGPAPPAGSRHTYVFTLYALPAASGVTAEMAGREAIDRIADRATATAKLRGEYETPN